MEEKYNEEFAKFGKRLKAIRKSRKLTQLDIEVTTGIYNGEISRIENGLKNIELITIIKLAEALKVELIELFNYEGALPKK